MPEPRASVPKMGFPAERPELHQWSESKGILEKASTYLLATVRPDGRPHVTPLWGVWLNDALYFATSEESRKGKNMAVNPRCAVSVSHGDLNLVVEGRVSIVRDEAQLQKVLESYTPKYDLPMVVRDGGVYMDNGDGGAVYVLEPEVGFSFTEEGGFAATRWRFG